MNYPPLQGFKLVLATLALSLAVFMEVLDSTIANVAVPVIAGDLGAATTQGTWVITSFAVANAISVPLTGFLAKRFGEVKIFIAAVIGFVVTSWLCGIAHNLQALVFFRVLQGFIAGPLIPLSQSLLMASYPPEKRTLALALWAMTVVVALYWGRFWAVGSRTTGIGDGFSLSISRSGFCLQPLLGNSLDTGKLKSSGHQSIMSGWC